MTGEDKDEQLHRSTATIEFPELDNSQVAGTISRRIAQPLLPPAPLAGDGALLREAREAAASGERERLAEWLHDGVLQSLNVASLVLANLRLELKRAATDPAHVLTAAPLAEWLHISGAAEQHLRLAGEEVRGWLRGSAYALPESFAAARQPDGELLGALRWLVAERLGFILDTPTLSLRPPPIDDTGRERRGQPPAAGFLDNPPAVLVQVRGAAAPLPPCVEAEVLAIVQESLLNAHRHGRARAISVSAEFGDDGVSRDEAGWEGPAGRLADTLTPSCAPSQPTPEPSLAAAPALRLLILDDGKPASGEFMGGGGANPDGYGLRAMRGRAARLGATLRITPAPPGGTCVSLELPPGKAKRAQAAPAPKRSVPDDH